MEIETSRLKVRSFVERDIEDYSLIVGDPRVMRFLGDGFAHDRKTATDYVIDCIGREAAGHPTRYAVTLKETGQLIGFSGFKILNGVLDFGYRFAASCWGRGIATEAGECVLTYGRSELQLAAITARARPDNEASAAVLKKLGFRPWNDPPFLDQQHAWFLLPD